MYSHNLKLEYLCDPVLGFTLADTYLIILDFFLPSSLHLTFLCDYITIPHQCFDISSPTLCVHYGPLGSKQQGQGVKRPKQMVGLYSNGGGVVEGKRA